MKTIPRIIIALLASFLSNALLLVVLSLDDRKSDSSWFRRFIEFIAGPPTFVVNAFFQSLPPIKMALAWIAVSIVYLAVVIWIGMTLFSLFRTPTHANSSHLICVRLPSMWGLVRRSLVSPISSE